MNTPTSDPMSQMDDDQLVALLRATFTAHEDLADVHRAHRIALQPPAPRRPRRPWLIPMAAAAAVVVVAGVGVALVPAHDRVAVGPAPSQTHHLAGPRPVPFQPLSSASAPAVERVVTPQERNNAAAEATVRNLATEMGAILRSRWGAAAEHRKSAPEADLLKTTPVPTTTAGSRWHTEWWTVEAPLAEVTAYLAKHHPAGTDAGGLGSGEGTDVAHYTTDTFAAPSTRAYTDAQVGFVAQAWRGGTALRIGSYAAPRSPRTGATYVTVPVTSIDVERVIGGEGPAPVITVTDSTTIAKLVHKLNSLAGVSVPGPGVYNCPMMRSPEPRLELVLHTTSGDVEANGGLPLCGPPAVQIVRAEPVKPELDATGYVAAVDRLLGLKANWWR